MFQTTPSARIVTMADNAKRPMAMVQFSAPVNLDGYSFPVTRWVQKPGQDQAWLVEDKEVWVGPDHFPLHGGLISHFRIARMAVAPRTRAPGSTSGFDESRNLGQPDASGDKLV